MGKREGGTWVWVFTWRRNFFDWEVEQKEELDDTILPASPEKEGDDLWEWTREGSISCLGGCLLKFKN